MATKKPDNQKRKTAQAANKKALSKSKQLKNTGSLAKKVGGQAQCTASILIFSCN